MCECLRGVYDGMKIISEYAIKRPVFTIVMMFLVLILGVVSLVNIPIKLIPEIKPPVGVVVTNYPGASPEEIVEKITKPLENNLATLPGIKTLTTTSQEGANFILLQFSWTTHIDEIQEEIIQRIDLTTLPEDAEKPRFLKFDPSQFPIIQLSLSSGKNEKMLRTLAQELKLELTKVNGVASINVSGTTAKEVKVELSQEKLKEFGLTHSDIVNLIQANNISMPGEPILTEGKQLTTRVISPLDSIDTLKNLTVLMNPLIGEEVTLSDISNVRLENQDDRTITRTNDNPSVLLSVLQQSDANTAEVSTAFIETLEKLLKEEKYRDIQSTIIFDQGEYIKQAIGNITNSLILGGLLAMIVLFFFLKSVKSPLIIGISIPYSVIFTFVLMYFSDYTLNIMTLGGLALGIGMLVDNSIVVIENIHRHLAMGKDAKEAARIGSYEVGGAITASTLTTVAVFLPVVFITGIIGELFKEFAVTISFSLIASLLVSLTLVPMLASRLLKTPKRNIEKERQSSYILQRLDRGVRWCLHHRALVLVTSTLLLVGGGLGLTTVGMQFLPKTDEGFLTIRVKLGNGTALSETEKVLAAIEKELKKEPDVDTYVSLIGTTQEGSFRGERNANEAEMYVKLSPMNKRTRSVFQFSDDVKESLEEVAVSTNATAILSFNMQSTAGSNPNTLTFSVLDTNKERLEESVNNIYGNLVKLEEVNDITTNQMEQLEEVQITVNRKEALKQGLMPAAIAMFVNNMSRGSIVTQMVDDDSEIYRVIVKYDEAISGSIEGLKGLLIKNPAGNYIELGTVTNIKRGYGPVRIERINQQEAVQFTLKYKDTTNLGFISRKVDQEIKKLKLAEETDIIFSGDRELLNSALNQLILAFILAITFVYLVMAAQFESLKIPLVIMFTVPLMVIGVALALTMTNTPISLTVIIGVIVLAGIVVNNAIVIIDYINQKKDQGIELVEAIIISVKERFRPILMTAITTILGLIPIALGIGKGTEINQPMGITVIGGLISSTFLTLFVIPVVYSIFSKGSSNSIRNNG